MKNENEGGGGFPVLAEAAETAHGVEGMDGVDEETLEKFNELMRLWQTNKGMLQGRTEGAFRVFEGLTGRGLNIPGKLKELQEEVATHIGNFAKGVAENAAPAAKAAAQTAAFAHVASIFARRGLLKGLGPATGAVVSNAILLFVTKWVVEGWEKKVKETMGMNETAAA